MRHCQNVGHEMTANKAARREISILTPTWYFHWHFPTVKLQNIEHLAKTTSNPADAKGTRLVLITLRDGCQERDLSSFRSDIPSVFFLSSRHSLLHRMFGRKHDETTSEESFVSLPTSLVQSELKKLIWDLDLDSSIGFPVTCAYLHNATHWTPGSNAWQRQQKIQKPLLTQRWSLSRLRVGCQSWDVCLHVEVRFPLYLSYRHSPQQQLVSCQHDEKESYESFVSVPIRLARKELKKKQIWDLGLHSRIGLPVTLSHLHNAAHWTSGLNTWQRQQENPEKLYWHKADRCHAWESDVSNEMFVWCRSQTPTVSFLSSFSTTPTFQKHNTIKKPKASFTSPLLHLVRSESKTEVRSRPWLLQNQISTDTVLHSHHNATNWTSCWTPGRENTNPETSHDKVEFATLRSQMSEVSCLSSCRNQIPTVSFLSSFYATPSYQTVVDTMKKKPLTRRCHDALLETKTGARISMTRTTCNRLNISQRIQITLPTLLTQGWSLPRCGFGCQRWDVGLHAEVRFPLYLSYRRSPQHQLLRCQHDEKESVQSFVSVPIRLAREKLF